MSTNAQTVATPRGRGRRPGFGGWRPFLYQLTSYALVASANALLSLTLINGVVFYGGIDGGLRLMAAAAATALAALGGAYILNSAWVFRSSALFRGELSSRFLLVGVAGAAAHLAVFAAVAYPLLAGETHPNRAASVAQLAALAAVFPATFLGLRHWAYRRGAAAGGTPPPLAAAGWTSPAELDPELASIAAGERQLRALWSARHIVVGYGGTLALLLAYGWYSTSHLGLNNGDGTARVTQAFAAVFSRDPHLGTLSLIWPPVPALVDLPLVVLLQPFGQAALAASIMGALFMAGAAVLLFLVLREVGAGRALATALTVAFVTHQHVYQSAAAGLSEAPFAMFLLGSMLAYLRWLKSESSGTLVVAGLMAAGATMSRYEAMFWVAAMAAGVAITLYRGVPLLPYFRSAEGRPPESREAISASLVAFVIPFGFVMAMWMWVNVLIKGNPLFFLVGPGSTRTAPDTARVFGEGHPFFAAYQSVGESLSLAVDRVTTLSPLIVLATAGLALYALRRRNVEVIAVGIVAWSITAFPTVTGYTGALPPWVRYWYWVVPMGFVLAAYGLHRIRLPGVRALAAGIVVVLAFVPNVRVFVETHDAFSIEQPGGGERVRNALLTTPDLGSVASRQASVDEYRRVAEAVEALTPPDALVMLDVIGPGGPIPMFARNPRRYVTTTDRDFEEEFLFRPWDTVDYVLVPFPTFDRFSRSLVLQAHDDIWEGAMPWTELVAEIDGPTRWRLFRVMSGAAATSP